MTRLFVAVSAALFIVGPVCLEASASCRCACVNGSVQALCSSSIDVQPVCMPMVCPVLPPSVQPVQTPMVPPVGATSCSPQQVLNPFTGAHEWKTICR